MKKITYLLTLFSAILCLGCVREGPEPENAAPEVYASVPVHFSLGLSPGTDGPGTRSAIEIDDDDIREVALLVFNAKDGRICRNASGEPFTTERTSRSFDWELPCNADGTPLDVQIYTICNYGSLTLPLSEPELQSASLDALTYSISSINELERGMPMAGVNNLTLTPETRTVELHVEKLFACFFFEFDTSELDAFDLSLQALHLTTHQVNTTVHWFGSGDRAGETTTLDYASEEDLRDLADGGQTYVYVLENRQGTIPGASAWNTVQQDLGALVSHCTYVDIGIKVLDQEGLFENRTFQVYLGDGNMVSDFDIPRNMMRTIQIRIPAENPDFLWDKNIVTIAPGGSREVTYTTNLPFSSLRFSTDHPGCTVRSTVSGKAVITLSEDVEEGERFLVQGGTDETFSLLRVYAKTPAVLTCNWTEAVGYVGYRSTFTIGGLETGEAPVAVLPSHPKSRILLRDRTVTYVPGGPGGEELTIRTSFGRDLPYTAPAAVLPALSGEASVLLSIDGTPVFPDVYYADPVRGTRLEGFDADFYADYLALTRSTVVPETGCPEDLIRTALSEAGVSVFTYHIQDYMPGQHAGSVLIEPVDYEGLSATVDTYIDDPGNVVQDLGELHDYTLIPDEGDWADDVEEVLSIETTWAPSSLRVDPSSLVYPMEAEGLTLTCTTGSTVSLIVRSDGQPGAGSVGIRVRNRNSGETVLLPLFTAGKHLHLAIGGVRSSVRRLGESEGTYGSAPGVAYTYYLGAADFASWFSGSEARRFRDWPEEARALIDAFRPGGALAWTVTVAGGAQVLATAGGYTSLYVTPGGLYGGSAGDGIQNQLFAVHIFGTAPSDDPAPYIHFSGYDEAYIHVHDYGELFPESMGWLPDGASGFSGWTEY